MIPALLKSQPILSAMNIEGQLFKVAGLADPDRKVVTINIVPQNLTAIITEEMKTKIEKQIADEWGGYSIKATYFGELKAYHG